ncbi:MAG: SLC13 family permease [Gemmatimonadota bacterium]
MVVWSSAWTSLAVFAACYVLFVVLPKQRALVACGGAGVLLATGALGWRAAAHHVNWNVIALTIGTLALAELFMASRMPAVLAEWVLEHFRTARGAMVAMAVLAGFISAAVENVAVVLLIAPVCLSLAAKLNLPPTRLLIFVAMFSNLQGTSTLIGDPPSMILAGHLKMDFLDFFWYDGRPGIFWMVQAGALAAALVVGWYYRHHRERVTLAEREGLRSWVPTILMLLLIVGLSVATLVDPDFLWFAGALAVGLGAAGLLWHGQVARWGGTPKLVRELDWNTVFFLLGVFAVVGGLSEAGWPARAAQGFTTLVGGQVFVAFLVVVLASVAISGFVDNVPYILVMLPVVDAVAADLGAPRPLLLYGLLVGACLGGNVTPIGATANVVTLGILRKQGITVGFGEYMKLGAVFTFFAVGASAAAVWFCWI